MAEKNSISIMSISVYNFFTSYMNDHLAICILIFMLLFVVSLMAVFS